MNKQMIKISITIGAFLIAFSTYSKNYDLFLDVHLHYIPHHDGFLEIADRPCEDMWTSPAING